VQALEQELFDWAGAHAWARPQLLQPSARSSLLASSLTRNKAFMSLFL
jgi:hypothetical protein